MLWRAYVNSVGYPLWLICTTERIKANLEDLRSGEAQSLQLRYLDARARRIKNIFNSYGRCNYRTSRILSLCKTVDWIFSLRDQNHYHRHSLQNVDSKILKHTLILHDTLILGCFTIISEKLSAKCGCFLWVVMDGNQTINSWLKWLKRTGYHILNQSLILQDVSIIA